MERFLLVSNIRIMCLVLHMDLGQEDKEKRLSILTILLLIRLLIQKNLVYLVQINLKLMHLSKIFLNKDQILEHKG
uniref:Ovule protein n=1 Tax=Acrobeloides nanus TaxID=290746 RepID=A0A914DGH4_9BILA